MIRVDGAPLAGQMSQDFSAANRSPAQTGQFRGEQVAVKDAASMLADAAEEISMHHSEKVESKELQERELKSESPIEVMKAEEITAYLEAAKAYDDPKKLADLAKRMQSSQENPRELARQQSRDPTQQFVLLQHALREALTQGASAAVTERLEDALADLEMESGPQIRAGLNVIGAASAFGASADAVVGFQSTYRDVVLGDNSLSQTLKLVLERLGGDAGRDFVRGLQGLVRALGMDLAAARPSTDGSRLQALVQDLYQLEVTATVLDNCQSLAAELQAKHGAAGLSPFELMKEMVSVVGEKWVGASRFTGLAERFGLTNNVGAGIAFQTGIKGMLRDIPVKVFADPDQRQTVLNAVQEALDVAIDKEEE